ncbi:MAG: nucleotidyltransferase domain-containing protein [Spirochaetaceae bacterium]|nr:nucleotidyltransferase domain-containing protein [Spirochaetaceae bacterium]
MRLTLQESESIKNSFTQVFGTGKIYLFGSRVDDSKKGGDIDLYICPDNNSDDMNRKKIEFLVKLDLSIGEQKVDVIIRRDKNRLIEREALKYGVEL